jgi:hypothetical protein
MQGFASMLAPGDGLSASANWIKSTLGALSRRQVVVAHSPTGSRRKGRAMKDEGDDARDKRLPDWLTRRPSIDIAHPDNHGISPEEGLRLVQAYVSIRSPALRQAVVTFIRELGKQTSSL